MGANFSGPGSAIESTSNSESIHVLLLHFALKMVGRSYDKSLTKKFDNKTWISKILVWLNHTTEVIFWMKNFFCLGHFLIIFSKSDGSKSDPSQKS